ncbi:MAG: pentapeptide repeat-containing protein [Devosia sp.]|nr:pentapeptide repeat-containing protein [Devosia sp.]
MDEVHEAGAEPDPVRKQRDGIGNHGIGLVGTAILVFILGIIVGIPIANFGADVLLRYTREVFAILFGVFLVILLVAGLVGLFRRQIWGAVFRRAEFEMERFARPLSDVARFAAEKRVDEATGAARDLAELVLARYAWVSTRRWLIATITALIAAIAALAGSALLFQQNRLLADQSALMTQQTDRLTEQNKLLESQIELGEAQRSAAIVSEIFNISAQLGAEIEALGLPDPTEGTPVERLSFGLKGRIIAATNMARPYRFLNAGLLEINDADLYRMALGRRTELLSEEARASVAASTPKNAAGELIDRIASPERGQLLILLANAFITDTEELTFRGADFSFAHVRMDTLKVMSLNHASLRFSDFSGTDFDSVSFRGAYLENARFRRSVFDNCDFTAVPANQANGPFRRSDDWVYRTQATGADFNATQMFDVRMSGSHLMAASFDEALLVRHDFTDSTLTGATFRNAALADVKFEGADLKAVELDGVITDRADFIAYLDEVTEPFAADRYEIAPVSRADLSDHPRTFELWLTGWPEDRQLYRVKRIKDFTE